jgi:hypothetical protein
MRGVLIRYKVASSYSSIQCRGPFSPKLADRLSHKHCFGDYANSFSHQKCMSSHFKPLTGIANQFNQGKPSCQKFGTQVCLSVGWGSPTLDTAVHCQTHRTL